MSWPGERENWRGESKPAVDRRSSGRPLAGRTPSFCSYADELVVVAGATSPSPSPSAPAAAVTMGERA